MSASSESVVREASASETVVRAEPWGQTAHGDDIELFTLANGAIEVVLTNFGARVVNLVTPDREGRGADIVLGYRTLAEYEADAKQYFGATIGRFANRIAHGRFTLDGQAYTVPANNGVNALHGGPDGFDRRVWRAQVIADGVEMSLTSPDGDMGFPGEMRVSVKMTLRGRDLAIEYHATSAQPTVLNLTNHSYFNLAGESSGTVQGQVIRIAADRYTPVSEELIPTGSLERVEGSPFDLRVAGEIGAKMSGAHEQLRIAGGYDHNFVLGDQPASEPRFAAEVQDPGSGRSMTVTTTEPGIQFYSGNFLDGTSRSKAGGFYVRNAGFCLETQHFPDSPNQPDFPTTLLVPGRPYRSTTVFSFGVDG